MAKYRVSGGDKITAYIQGARQKSRVKRLDVGFFRKSRYPDGTPVTNVAAWNEYGTRPPRRLRNKVRRKWWSRPRPFMRLALPNMRHRIRLVIRQAVQTGRPFKITLSIANRIGLAAQAAIVQSIITLRTPKNRDKTIELKGSSNPLIDTGTMKGAVTYDVIRK